MKKKSHSPEPPGKRPESPTMPAAPAPQFNAAHMAAIFNLWNLRYSENPDDFGDCLDENGKPVDDYGENCAIHFQKLSDEIHSS